STIDLDKKNNILQIAAEDSMKIKAIIDVLISRMAKQGLDGKSLELNEAEYASGVMIKKDLKVKSGIEKEVAKKIVKDIKDSKLKVTPAQMDEMVRVTAKKIDDLQSVISLLRPKDYGIPLQFINM